MVMVFTALNASFLQAVFAAPPSLPARVGSPAGDTMSPPPPAPPSAPQAEIPNGTITSAAAISRATSPPPPTVNITGSDGTTLTVTTGYGQFVVNSRTASSVSTYLHGVLLGETTFGVVTREGRFLSPTEPSVESLPAGFLSVYSMRAGAVLVGTMQVYYNFTATSDKITAVLAVAPPFRPMASSLSIVWLGFTPLPYVATASLQDSSTPFDAIAEPGFWDLRTQRTLSTSLGDLKEIGYNDGSVSLAPTSGTSPLLKMVYSDAVAAYNGTFANGEGMFAYAGMTGNSVAVSFLPGVLRIDPQVVAGASSPLVPFSIQRKVISYGSVDWVFFLDANQIDYAYTMPSASSGYSGWSALFTVPGTASSYILNGFTVVHFGSTVDIIWADGGNPDTKILTVEGLISQGTGQSFITWRSTTADLLVDTTQRVYRGGPSIICGPGHPSCNANIQAPVTAEYAPNGQLDFAYVVTLAAYTISVPMLDRESCGDVYCSPGSGTFNEVNIFEGTSWAGEAPGSANGVLVVPFNDPVGTVAVVWTTNTAKILQFNQWVNGTATGGEIACANQLNSDSTSKVTPFTLPTDFDPKSQLAAAPTGTVSIAGTPIGPGIELFVPTNDGNGNYLEAILLTEKVSPTQWSTSKLPTCIPAEDKQVEYAYQVNGPNLEPHMMSASTEWDGNSIDLFFSQGSGPLLTHLRAIPEQTAFIDMPGSAMLPWSGTYNNPIDVTAEDTSGHYVFGAFDYYWANRQGSGYNLELFEFPVPTDYNAGPNDPWVQLPGGPSVDEQGGSVNPSSGILTYQLPLVSTPVRKGTETLSLAYVEPGLYYGSASALSIARDASPCDSAGFCTYGYFVKNSMFLDLPWIDTRANLLHLGLNTFDIVWNQPPAIPPCPSSGSTTYVYWFNNTRGTRFNLETQETQFSCNIQTFAQNYTLFTGMGETYDFDITGELSRAYLDSTGNNYLSYLFGTTGFTIYPHYGGAFPVPASYQPITVNFLSSSVPQIQSIQYEDGRTISFTYPTSNSVQVTDAVGRIANFTYMTDGSGRLSSVALPAGGRVNYTYLQNIQWGTGNDVESLYTFPVSTETVYNETLTNKIARQLQFNYHFQNLEDVETDVRVADASAVWQGATEYRFQSDRSMSSVRTIDDTSNALYYDMQTTQTCGTSTCMTDLSGNGNSGAISGTTAKFGRWGQAQYFNGASSISIPARPTLLPKYGLTVAGWFNTASLGNYWAISNWASTGCSSTACSYLLAPSYGGSAPYYPAIWLYSGSKGADIIGTQTIPTNTWVFVAATFSLGQVKLYVSDGTHLANPYETNATFTTLNSASTLATTLGSASGSNWGSYTGYMDEVRIFDRALSSDEINSLYYDNAIQIGMTQYWWSSVAQPLVVDQFKGYGLTTPWSTSLNYLDDWGNVIYTRDAYGQERFSSYANTNHEGEFYVPARLDKVSSGVLYQNSFDYGIDDLTPSSQSGDASASMDYANFGRYAPSMKIAMTQSGSDIKVARSFGVSTSAATAEFHIEFADTSTNWLQFSFTSGASVVWWVRFSGGSINMGGPAPPAAPCGSYVANTWYTVALQEFNGALYLNVNRVNVCTISQSTSVSGLTLEATNAVASGGYVIWMDDIRVINGCNGGYAVVCINGLKLGQLAELLDPSGTVLGTVQQASTGTVGLYAPSSPAGSFNAVTVGDATILIFGVDGTLEYVSPRTDFIAGDVYNYVPPRTLMGRLALLRAGFDYFSSMSINVPNDISTGTTACWDAASKTQCSWTSGGAGWSTFGFLPTTDSPLESHTLGWSQSVMSEWVSGLSSSARGYKAMSANNFLVNYAYLASSAASPAQQSVGYAFGAESASNSTFIVGTWGTNLVSTSQPNGANPLYQKFMGVIPVTSEGFTVMKFIVKEADLFGSSTSSMNGYYYQTDGGRGAFFAGTSIGTTDSGSVDFYGMPTGYTVTAYWAGNSTVIATSPGSQGPGTVTAVSLYPKISVFPASLKFRFQSGSTIIYDSPAVSVWGGDQFNYLGQSEFYDEASASQLPGPTIHNAVIGQRASQGDCTSAILCYDMESIGTSADVQNIDGSAWATVNDVVDLSGHGNHGTLQVGSGFQLAGVSISASGLGLSFPGSSSWISTNYVQTSVTQYTISAWVETTSTADLPIIQDRGTGAGMSLTMTVGYNGGQGAHAGTVNFGLDSNNLWIGGYTAGTTVNDGKVHHIVGVFSAPSGTSIVPADFTVYVDGRKVALTTSAAGSATSPVTGSGGTAVGYHSTWNAYFSGVIDQLGIYTSAFTANQVMGLYRSRLPNAQATFAHMTAYGMPDKVHSVLNGQYLEKTISYDANGWGLPISSTWNGNTTYYSYSGFDNGAFLTQLGRADGLNEFYPHDPYTGSQLGTITENCAEIVRNGYDAANRLTQTAYYSKDPATVLDLDMETTAVTNTAQSWAFQDVSCTAPANSISTTGSLGVGQAVYGPTSLSGMAQNFDGSSYIKVQDYGALDPATFTISAWLYPTATPTNYYRIMAKDRRWTSPYQGWILLYSGATGQAGKIYLAVFNTAGTEYDSTLVSLSTFAWQQVAFTFDGSKICAFLNGAQIKNGNGGCNTLSGTYQGSTNPLVVGSGDSDNLQCCGSYAGYMGEVRIFSGARTQAQLQSLAAGTYGLMSSSTVAHDDTPFPSVTTYDGAEIPRSLFFDFDTLKPGQPQGQPPGYTYTYEDVSGNGNDGIGYRTAPCSPALLGNCAYFNGPGSGVESNSYVNVPNSQSLTSMQVTVSFWGFWTTLPTNYSTPVVTKSTGSGYAGPYWFELYSSGRLAFYVGTADGQNTAAVINGTTAGNGHVYTGTYDGGTINLYKDGSLVQSVSHPGTIRTSTGALTIGKGYGTGGTGYGTWYLHGAIDELQIIPQALSAAQVQAMYKGYTPGSTSFDPTHMSRTYFDGLGRPVRQVILDTYHNRLTTADSMGWNDQPAVSFLTTGQYSTYVYSYPGLLVQAVSPGGLSVSTAYANFSAPNTFIYSADGDGHTEGVGYDLLGRTWGIGAVNPANNTVNYTLVQFNALNLVARRSEGIKFTTIESTIYYYNAAGLLVFETYPDGTNQTWTYDNDLRISTVTDALGHFASYAYVTSGNGQGLGWLQSLALRASASSSKVYYDNYTYDPAGDVLTITNTSATVSRTYDAMQRMTLETINIGGIGLSFGYVYDNASRLAQLTYPQSQGSANYLFDSLGRISQVNWANASYAAIQFDAYGRLQKVSFLQANSNTNEYENYSYDVMNRVTAVSVLGGTNLMQLLYGYDSSSLVTSISDNMFPGGTSSVTRGAYAYNMNGRLISVSGQFSANGLNSATPKDNRMDYVNYSYDSLGNILVRQDSDYASSNGCSPTLWCTAQTVTYSYKGTYNELTAASVPRSETFVYDPTGSMIGRSNWAYAYDFQGRLVRATSTSPAYTYTYTYDGLGRRVQEVDAMKKTYTLDYAYVGSTLAYQYNASSGVKSSFVFLGSEVLFRIDSGSATAHFYAADLSRNVRLVWSYSTAVVVEAKNRYKPFGEMATPLVSPTSSPVLQFAEQANSPPTKLYPMGARWYAPDLGRFISRDPAGGHGYTYARDDPIVFWDPSGQVSGLIHPFNPPQQSDPFSQWLAGVVNSFNPFGWADPMPNYKGPCSSGPSSMLCNSPWHLLNQWWKGLPPSTRRLILTVAVVLVVSALTAGALDAFVLPTALAEAETVGVAGTVGVVTDEAASVANDLDADVPPIEAASGQSTALAEIPRPTSLAVIDSSGTEITPYREVARGADWIPRSSGQEGEGFISRLHTAGEGGGFFWTRDKMLSREMLQGFFGKLSSSNLANEALTGVIKPNVIYWSRIGIGGLEEIFVNPQDVYIINPLTESV